MTTQAPPKPDSFGPDGKPDVLIDRRAGLIGAPVSRIDGSPKVRGAARFAAEIPLEGMVYAALAFSAIAKGRIASLDTAAAEAAAGVVLVMTHKNSPPMKPSPPFLTEHWPRAATTYRLCKTTASIGTGSRLPSSSQRRKSRRTSRSR